MHSITDSHISILIIASNDNPQLKIYSPLPSPSKQAIKRLGLLLTGHVQDMMFSASLAARPSFSQKLGHGTAKKV